MFLTIAQIRSQKVDVSECPSRRTLITPDIEFAVVRIKKIYGSTVISSKNRAVVSMIGGMGKDGLNKVKVARLPNRNKGIYFWSENGSALNFGVYVSLNNTMLRIYSEDVNFSDGLRPTPLATYTVGGAKDYNISIRFHEGLSPIIRYIDQDGILYQAKNLNEEEHDEYSEYALSRVLP